MEMYKKGMKIAIFTDEEGWTQGGENIEFYENEYINESKNENYFSLKFEYKFKCTKAKFAYSIPYTYTDLCKYLGDLLKDKAKSNYIKKSTLCKTFSGLNCEYLIISSKDSLNLFDQSKKRAVIFTARVQPGEIMGSWMMKGVIDFLISKNNTAKLLRDNFIFVIIPMLNPDGVIYGNYRSCALGTDLNRKYQSPSKVLNPTIYYTKKLIIKINYILPIALYVDFHGHSGRYFFNQSIVKVCFLMETLMRIIRKFTKYIPMWYRSYLIYFPLNYQSSL